MTVIYIVCFILMVVGIIFALHLTPEQINEDISQLFTKKESLKDRALSARGKKKKSKLMASLENMRRVLQETGKEKHFSIALMASLLLMVAGSIVAILIDNYFLIPVLAIAFAMIPFAYLLKTIGIYETHMREELETALSIVTTSYLRCESITIAVAENIPYLKPPMRGVFEAFLAETTIISPDVRRAIYNMKGKIKNSIFEEWCDTLITRLESRVGSTMMSDVTRGLIGVFRGNNMSVYWSTTAMKFSDIQRQNLKSQANAVPRKVRKLSMALLFCFILIYVAVLGQVLLTSMGTLF